MTYSDLRFLSVSLVVVFATGCADRRDFPSLAPRPIELGTNQPVAAAPPVLSSSPKLLERTDAAMKLAESGLPAFAAALSAAQTSASASNGVTGSELWVAAQMSLSQLERARAPAATAMSNLDDARRTLLMGAPSSDVVTVEAAWARVQDIYQSQTEASQRVAAAANRR